MQHQLFINGALVDGEGEKQAVFNPATGRAYLFNERADESGTYQTRLHS